MLLSAMVPDATVIPTLSTTSGLEAKVTHLNMCLQF